MSYIAVIFTKILTSIPKEKRAYLMVLILFVLVVFLITTKGNNCVHILTL